MHPEAAEFLSDIRRRGFVPLHTLSVEGARSLLADLYSSTEHIVEDVETRDLEIAVHRNHQVGVRLYQMEEIKGASNKPIILYLHGGGWVLGNIGSADNVCRLLTKKTGALVVSVDYRLAPENAFPAAVRDSYGVLKWISQNGHHLGGDQDHIAIAGDSAGGNLAAVSAQIARDQSGPSLEAQLLIYPQTDYRFDSTSYVENSDGYYLHRKDLKWFWNLYLESWVSGNNPYASPLRAQSLSDLPPAYVITCGLDPLRDDGRRYADRLESAGVDVTHREYEDHIHGFFTKPSRMESAKNAITDAASFLIEQFS